MSTSLQRPTWGPRQFGVFALIQVAVMLLAISHQSLWIDEFWTAHFAALPSFKAFFDLLLVPSGSQTPLHFVHFYLWEQVAPAGEFFFRLANLPFFVAGQLAVFWALRDYPRTFAYLFLALNALHPMVWQYADEARPYMMMVAGSQMILAYLLNLHVRVATGLPAEPLFLLLFVVGGILLFGASMLGMFWVFVASVYVLVHHLRKSKLRELTQGMQPWLIGFLAAALAVLTAYYLNSLIKGAGASRLDSSTPATVLFAAYEMLGLAGLGPSRLELRESGMAALGGHLPALLAAGLVLTFILTIGLKTAHTRLGTRRLLWMSALGLFPVLFVLFSGFVMHWRVLGRHLIAALPLLNLVMALGMAKLVERPGGRPWRRWVAVSGLLLLLGSSLSLRFGEHHRKDDYRSAASIAQQALAQGKRVWWAADAIGADYYKLPGQFDVIGELTGVHQPLLCIDQVGVHSLANAPDSCLRQLSRPDLVILSKPDGYDIGGSITAYLKANGFVVTQRLPAFAIWQAPVSQQPRP